MDRDDRLSPLARWLFMPLIPFTAVFGPLLVLLPNRTDAYWSWEITPAMSAVWVGAGYTFGACAISTMLVLGRWRTAILAILATIPFAVAMLVATLIHLDRFATGTPRFWVWMTIYAVLPIGLPVIYLMNRKQDPGVRPDDRLLPRPLAILGGATGLTAIAVGLVLFASPGSAAFWPWHLTPLMARVVAGWLFFFGTGAALLLVERRVMAVRAFLPSVAVWFGVLSVAALFHLDDFVTGPVATTVYFVCTIAVVATAVGIIWHTRGHSAAKP